MRSRLLLLFLLTLPAFAADQPHFPTNEEMRHFRRARVPRLSPDGKQVLVQIQESAADGGATHLWLVDIPGNSFRQLTFSPASAEKDKSYRGESGAEWMPDGDILFLAKRGEHRQLFHLPMQGGEAVPFDLKITPAVDDSKLPEALPPPAENATEAKQQKPTEPLPIDVSGFQIAPDGGMIALWANDPQTPGEKAQDEAKADAVLVDHEHHGSRLYLLDVATKKLTPAAVPPDVRSVSWSEDSSKLLAEVEAPNHADDLGPADSVWLVEVSTPEHPTKLPLPPTAEGASWSRDGNTIFYLAQTPDDAPPGYLDLFQLSPANNVTVNLSRGFKGTMFGERAAVDANGNAIERVITSVQPSFARFAPGKPPEVLQLGAPSISDLATNDRRSGWVYLASASTQNQPEILEFSETLGAPPQALPLPPLSPAGVSSAASQLITWQSDKQTIEGLLYMPAGANGPVPLIVDVHGGPTGAWLDGYDQFVNFLIGHGWAVFRPNPRGSVGRGVAFAAANKNDLGGGDYRDIMSGVDAVLKKFPIDPSRLALIGYSYGGEMAGFVEGKTSRFRAIVSGAPVIDQFSEYGTESDSWYDRWFFGKPWERQTDALRQSPLAGAGHASTPFLLLQGKEDSTDPAGQSREMYRALRQMNVPVELVEYPRDNHGPLSQAIQGQPTLEPWHGFDARQRIVEFIEKAFAGKASSQSTVNSAQ